MTASVAAAVGKWPACARLSAVAPAGHLPTAPTPPGGTRPARLGNVTLQIVPDWGMRFNADGPAGLLDRKASGPMPRLTAMHRQALAAQIDRGPIPAVHGVVRCRLCDLGQSLWEAFRVTVSPQTLSRGLRAMGTKGHPPLGAAGPALRSPSTAPSARGTARQRHWRCPSATPRR